VLARSQAAIAGSAPAAEVLRKKGRRPGFLAYDWSLNGR